MTYNGVVDALIEPTPRICISPDAPGAPVVELTLTPETLPDNILSTDSEVEVPTSSSEDTFWADPVKEDFFDVP